VNLGSPRRREGSSRSVAIWNARDLIVFVRDDGLGLAADVVPEIFWFNYTEDA
jgi:C4-dicarboxylate-specific signal transduction histidine kinase